MELAGILSMHLVSRIMAWNETHEKQAPIGWAIAGTASYSIIALSIIVLLDWPPSRVTAVKGMFVLLGVVVYMLFALYHQQVRRERNEQGACAIAREDTRWEYEANQQYKLERYRIKVAHELHAPAVQEVIEVQPASAIAQRGTYAEFCIAQAAQNGNGDMKVADIQEQFNVSRRTAYNWISKQKGG